MVGGDVGVQSGADLSGEIGGIMKSLCRAMSCRICPFLSGIRYCQYHQYHQLLTISSVTSILYIYQYPTTVARTEDRGWKMSKVPDEKSGKSYRKCPHKENNCH